MKFYYIVGHSLIDDAECWYCNNSGCSQCYEQEEVEFKEGRYLSEEEMEAVRAAAPAGATKAVTLDKGGVSWQKNGVPRRLWLFRGEDSSCLLDPSYLYIKSK